MVDAARRMLLVHAHPDDESITTGATIARYVAEGAQVTVLTCTLGEEGEILVPALAGLEAAQADQLGGYRIGELAAAMRALGVTDHRFLGGAGRFRDSGMLGTPPNAHPRAFWRAVADPVTFDAAVASAVAVIREVCPQVVVTYDPDGDYGHPDHVMAHRVATAAARAAADATYGTGDAWAVRKFYWTATPVSDLAHDFAAVGAASGHGFEAADPADLTFGVADELVTATIDARDHEPAKCAALKAHRTQVLVRPPFYALSNRLGRRIRGVEHFRLADGRPGGELTADGREQDLFAGVAG